MQNVKREKLKALCKELFPVTFSHLFQMAYFQHPCLLFLLLITASSIGGNMIHAEARRLLEMNLPNIPKPEFPPLPEVPTLPKPEIPELPKPELPNLPKPEIPAVPNPELPTLPEIPQLPKVPELPKPTVPTYKTSTP